MEITMARSSVRKVSGPCKRQRGTCPSCKHEWVVLVLDPYSGEPLCRACRDHNESIRFARSVHENERMDQNNKSDSGARARAAMSSGSASGGWTEPASWALPAIRGVQAQHEYYVVLVRLRELSHLLAPIDAKLPPELRAQRVLNKARVPRIAEYILGNPTGYTFSSLVGAVDGLPRFEPAAERSRMGTLYIPRTMTVALLDGQHRRAAIEQAVREDNAKKKGSTGLGDETISIVLFVDGGLEKSQQKFADLNRFGVRPNGSLALLYDHRDELANLAKAVVREVPLFAKLTDGEKTSIAGGSGKLFALNAVHDATRALLRGANYNREESKKVAVSFWSKTAGAMRDWQAVAEGKIKASELREKYIHAHAVALEAFGRAGNALLRERPETWKTDLAALATIDWSRTSPIWQGRALVNGRVSKTATSVVLTSNVLKKHLGLELGVEDRRYERG
jgi:DNA sulfur modification protein DndB